MSFILLVHQQKLFIQLNGEIGRVHWSPDTYQWSENPVYFITGIVQWTINMGNHFILIFNIFSSIILQKKHLANCSFFICLTFFYSYSSCFCIFCLLQYFVSESRTSLYFKYKVIKSLFKNNSCIYQVLETQNF